VSTLAFIGFQTATLGVVRRRAGEDRPSQTKDMVFINPLNSMRSVAHSTDIIE